MLSWLDAALAALGDGFIRAWGYVERSYRRPLARLAFRLKFAFYPLLALAALGWLAWDWAHERSLDAAENAIFDKVVNWRPLEPTPSGRVAVVEIDECSIEHFRMRGEGGWPWSRQRHADLLDRLDREGAQVVGYDVLFADPSKDDPDGDRSLETMAGGGYIIRLPASGTIIYTDSTVPAAGGAKFGPFDATKSVWTIEVERLP